MRFTASAYYGWGVRIAPVRNFGRLDDLAQLRSPRRTAVLMTDWPLSIYALGAFIIVQMNVSLETNVQSSEKPCKGGQSDLVRREPVPATQNRSVPRPLHGKWLKGA
jgi:hypothetical protein